MKPLALFLLLSACGVASAIPQDEVARADARVHEITITAEAERLLRY